MKDCEHSLPEVELLRIKLTLSRAANEVRLKTSRQWPFDCSLESKTRNRRQASVRTPGSRQLRVAVMTSRASSRSLISWQTASWQAILARMPIQISCSRKTSEFVKRYAKDKGQSKVIKIPKIRTNEGVKDLLEVLKISCPWLKLTCVFKVKVKK